MTKKSVRLQKVNRPSAARISYVLSPLVALGILAVLAGAVIIDNPNNVQEYIASVLVGLMGI